MKTSDTATLPEVDLLLCCIRASIDLKVVERIDALLDEDIDWSKLLEMANSFGVIPLLYKNLKTIQLKRFPKTFLVKLQDHFHDNARNAIRLTGELVKILDLFEANNIPAIPYKGPVLAAIAYGNLTLRQFGDIDVIIHKQDVRQARELLISQGYQLTWPQLPLTEHQEISHLEAKYNYKFVHQNSNTIVELHWGVTPKYFSFPPDPNWLWSRLENVSLSGKSMLSFSPEDYLLILCVHGANHCWLYRLSWICDISELIHNHPGLNWEQVIEQAYSLGSQRMLLLGLLLAHDLLGSQLPDEIWHETAKDSTVKSLADQVKARFTNRNIRALGAFEIPLFHLDVKENLQDKIRYCFYMTTPSTKDWTSLSIPKPFIFFYYIFRPIRLAIEYGLPPLKHRLGF